MILSTLYCGRAPSESVHRNLGKDMMTEFMRPFYITGRNIVHDNFLPVWPNDPTVSNHLENAKIIGRFRTTRREALPVAQCSGSLVHSSTFLNDRKKG